MRVDIPPPVNQALNAMTCGTKVLIVDDDDDIRATLQEVLREEGCTVYEAKSGAEALAALRNNLVPDLILLDLMMPVMSGWTVYASLQQDPAFAQIPVVVLSAAAHLLPEGPVMQLRKPIDLSILLQLLATVDAPQSARRSFLPPPP